MSAKTKNKATTKGGYRKCGCDHCTKWSPLHHRILKKLGPKDRKLFDEFLMHEAMQSDDLGAAEAKLAGEWPGWHFMEWLAPRMVHIANTIERARRLGICRICLKPGTLHNPLIRGVHGIRDPEFAHMGCLPQLAPPEVVKRAQKLKICRICLQPDIPSQGNSIILNFGQEYAHEKCLGVKNGQTIRA